MKLINRMEMMRLIIGCQLPVKSVQMDNTERVPMPSRILCL